MVEFEDMILFSRLSGIVATDIWLIYLKWNAYFEATAILHRIINRGHLGAPKLTPTFIEEALHRLVIRKSGQKDQLSERWDTLLEELEEQEVSVSTLTIWLNEIDARGGVDLFDREENLY